MSASRLHYDFLVMPLGLTNTLVIFHSCRQWKRHLLLLFHALIIYSRAWDFHLRQWDETSGIVAMTELLHLDHVISAQSAQDEIQTLLDQFTKISVGIGSGGHPIWRWNPSIHQSDRLPQMMWLIKRVVSVICLHHCGDVVRGVVEVCSI
jgi:hypothetical protein